MHEMALAQGVLDIALRIGAENQASRIARITVAVGAMTGVVADSLQFGFTALAADTIAAKAELVIRNVPLTGRCRECAEVFPIDNYCFVCPHCGGAGVEILSGRELRVEDMEVE